MIAPDQTTAQIFNRLKTSERPYLITGSQASYCYHRWLSPAPKVIELRIFPEDYEWWKNFLRDAAAHVSDLPPMSNRMENLDSAIILSKNLETSIYQHRRTFADLHYESPEELCLDLLQISIAETTAMESLAIWLVQRQTFQWDYFCEQATVLGLTREAGILLDVVNEHTQQSLMPQFVIDQLFKKTAGAGLMNDCYYPHTWRVKLALRRQNENEKDLAITYPQTSRKWGIKVVLPRYIMDKLTLDLDYVLRNYALVANFENRPSALQLVA